VSKASAGREASTPATVAATDEGQEPALFRHSEKSFGSSVDMRARHARRPRNRRNSAVKYAGLRETVQPNLG